MPLILDSPVPAAPPPAAASGELAPGEFVFGVLGDVLSTLESDVLLALVGALQRGDPWTALPKRAQAACADLDARLFDEAG